MLKNIITGVSLVALSAGMAQAGGWETGALDTGFTFNDGTYAEFSTAKLNYSIGGKIDSGVTHGMAKDQSRSAASAKFQVGKLHVGVTTFDSGAIQMDGQSAAADRSACYANVGAMGAAVVAQNPGDQATALSNMKLNCSLVPSADVKLNTTGILARYEFNDRTSIIGGLRQVKLSSSTVSTLKTNYTIEPESDVGVVYGFAYEVPDIALKAEVIRSEAMTMPISGNASGGLVTTALPLSNSTVGVPEALTIKFQTGIAENTLLMASAHKVKWKASQITVDVAGDSFDVASDFADTASYSLGLGRKFSENTSASISYSWEKGSGPSSTSAFTMSNGSKTLSVGLKYQMEALSASAGLSYTQVGDVTSSSGGLSAVYSGNSVTAIGVKVGYTF